MKLEQVHPNFVCQVWPAVEEYLSLALEYAGGEYSVEQLQFMLVRGEQILLVAVGDDGIKGAAAVTFENYPAARVGFITAIGGKLITSNEMFGQLVEWMKDQGCTKIRGAARESVARLWRQKFGFQQRYIIVEQSL